MKKIKSKAVKVAIFVAISLATLFYFAVLLARGRVETLKAEVINFSDDISTVGFAVRDEQLVETEQLSPENVMFNFKDGEKVSKGSALAKVYESQKDVKNAYMKKGLAEDLKRIESKPYSYSSEGASLLNQNIADALSKYMLLSCGEKKRVARQELWEYLNKKAINLGKGDGLEQLKNSLKSRENEISVPGNPKVITAEFGGQFSSRVDGFETAFNYSELPEVCIDLGSITPKSSEKYVLGKIIKNDTWFAVMNITDEEAKRISKSGEIKLSVDGKDYAKDIPCELKSLKKDPSGEKYLLVLSCNYISNNLASLRKENFKVTIANYHGIKIPKSALRKQESDFGVYVKRAGYLKFKKIDIVFAENDFVVASYNSENYDDENYIQPGDKIIISGGKLYEGKKTK